MSIDGKAVTEQQDMYLGSQEETAGEINRYWVRETEDCWVVMKADADFVKLPKRLTGNSKVAALEIAVALRREGRLGNALERLKCSSAYADKLERELDEARREAYSLKKELETARNMRKRDNIALAQLVQNAQEML